MNKSAFLSLLLLASTLISVDGLRASKKNAGIFKKHVGSKFNSGKKCKTSFKNCSACVGQKNPWLAPNNIMKFKGHCVWKWDAEHPEKSGCDEHPLRKEFKMSMKGFQLSEQERNTRMTAKSKDGSVKYIQVGGKDSKALPEDEKWVIKDAQNNTIPEMNCSAAGDGEAGSEDDTEEDPKDDDPKDDTGDSTAASFRTVSQTNKFATLDRINSVLEKELGLLAGERN